MTAPIHVPAGGPGNARARGQQDEDLKKNEDKRCYYQKGSSTANSTGAA